MLQRSARRTWIPALRGGVPFALLLCLAGCGRESVAVSSPSSTATPTLLRLEDLTPPSPEDWIRQPTATRTVISRDATLAASDHVLELTWQDMMGLDLESGEPSPQLTALNGTRVKVAGYMVPLEDTADRASDFLLVPYLGACIHVPPPPANQIVHVLMADGRAVKVSYWDPIWIHGTLQIENNEHAYGQASFLLVGDLAQTYEYEPQD